MKKSMKGKGVVIAAAAAGLVLASLAGCSSMGTGGQCGAKHSAGAVKHMCKGENACKGKNSCKGNGCGGK